MSTQAQTKLRPLPDIRRSGEKVAGSTVFKWLARAGFVARGLVYIIIGILAIRLALGDGGTSASQQGALRTIAAQPFGKALLILVAIGLGGYALWRLVRALLGRGPEGSDSGIDRIGALASGIVYAGLARSRLRSCSAPAAAAREALRRRLRVCSAGPPAPGWWVSQAWC
jgi:hypothetical protein